MIAAPAKGLLSALSRSTHNTLTEKAAGIGWISAKKISDHRPPSRLTVNEQVSWLTSVDEIGLLN